ncbi:SDR family NAD(P)-dependent oxidoreductase [Castellaniella sp.]|uniref:SDR family NAD(P)-dependent oxidoreductase n=1 Tax=Castellaniella sp. TaxID=1955812 RepID=UPI00355E7DBE
MIKRYGDYFDDKVILITGAASGMGREAALLFGGQGASVVCADIDEGPGEDVAGTIRAEGGESQFIRTDVTRRPEINRLVEQAMAKYGKIDFLFNSAGSALKRSKFLDIDEDLLNLAIDLNFKSVFNMTQAVLPHMLQHQFGVIVNVSSMSVKRGGPGASIHYAAAKGAVTTLTLGVAREFAKEGIRCLSISPGPFDTAFQKASGTTAELAQKFLADVPMNRLGRPSEIAELVLFMCSNVCEFMTADTVYVNGGGGYR